MIYIVVIIIVLGIVGAIFQWIVDTVGGGQNLLLIIAGIGLLIMAILNGFVVPLLIAVAAIYGIRILAGAVHSLGVNTKAAAEKNAATADSRERHNNELALQQELENNCKHLGQMSLQDWYNKLPNFAGKKYITDFESIVENFSSQVEQEHITQNREWLQPYLDYIVLHPTGMSILKLLNEVKCPSLQYTHATDNKELLQSKLDECCNDLSKDVPALLRKVSVPGYGEAYTPSPYLVRLTANTGNMIPDTSKRNEINLDDEL